MSFLMQKCFRKCSVLLALLWLHGTGHTQSAQSVLPAYPPMGSVRNEIRMQLTPHQRTILSSEIPGRITQLTVKEGESFDTGELLIKIDCSMHQARLDKAVAQAKEAEQVLAVNTQLDRLGSISVLEVEVAGSRLAAAAAEADLMRTIVKRCEINAPFSGKVAALEVKAHQYVAEGQELLSILDDSAFDVEMVVPSRWISQLSAGQQFELVVDETGESYPAFITRFGASIDAVSQSIKIFGRIDGDFPELRAGMSGVARLMNQ
ncbi:MAG: efflux transporter periplasmic adaptor subunit [Gammaproteobacteria bacterium]|nr:efflux transporter periplasmic adaptor subunit [Gammaproteobacteria bacterium]MBJ54834.1 efflux transporter periplasmic adaptor subunit [Gammaproteobacteria bacterium]HBN15640.1 efflux transporter periplasmic adaptor subunit [Pseudohongiella sp.]|tara:strand:+ start:2229 stop:3017 length:789 start_codon:yes stop_codon:yes gene_type:complete